MIIKLLSGLKSGICFKIPESSIRQQWTLEEEDGLRRGLQKYGPGSWKEIKEHEPVLVNRTAAQIKEKVLVAYALQLT